MWDNDVDYLRIWLVMVDSLLRRKSERAYTHECPRPRRLSRKIHHPGTSHAGKACGSRLMANVTITQLFSKDGLRSMHPVAEMPANKIGVARQRP